MNVKQNNLRFRTNANNKNHVINLLIKSKDQFILMILLSLTVSTVNAQWGATIGTPKDTYVINSDNSKHNSALRFQNQYSAFIIAHKKNRLNRRYLDFSWLAGTDHQSYGPSKMKFFSDGKLELGKLSISPGSGNGISFWDSPQYKIHMGHNYKYHYGPVTGYSIKMNMSNHSERGWTWGVYNQQPIAALSTDGHMKLAGTLNVKNLQINGIRASIEEIIQAPGYGEANFGQKSSHTKYKDFDERVEEWGWNYVQGNDNAPNEESSQWYRHISSLGRQYGISTYRLEIAYPRFNQAKAGVWMRTLESGNSQPWVRIDGGKSETLAIGGDLVEGSTLSVDGRVYISEEGGSEKGFGSMTNDKYKNYLLWVEEGIVSDDLAIASISDWPDYVFSKDYNLPSLATVEKNIKENGHLHTMLSGKEIEKNGFTVSDMTKRVVKTIEELTLYTIAQEKQIEAQNKLIKNLSKRLEKLEKANK